MPSDVNKFIDTKNKIKKYNYKTLRFLCRFYGFVCPFLIAFSFAFLFIGIIVFLEEIYSVIASPKMLNYELILFLFPFIAIPLAILFLNKKRIKRFLYYFVIITKRHKKEDEKRRLIKESRNNIYSKQNNSNNEGYLEGGCGCLIIIIAFIGFLFTHCPWWAALIILLLLFR